MNLFINAISQNWALILFDEKRIIISQKNIEILWNESSKLIEEIDIFLKENNITYSDLKNLVVVNWPGSFTWVRTIVLAINTINFIIYKNITDLSFFDLFEKYPIIKSSSKRDLFVKFKKSDNIQIIKNDDFLNNLSTEDLSPLQIFWDISNNIISEQIKVNSEINYNEIIKNITFKNNKSIEPLYIKKPNIS